MVKYFCSNCHDEQLGTSVAKVITHVWRAHRIELERTWEAVVVAEDALSSLNRIRKMKVTGYRCEGCKLLPKNISLLLEHLDEEHGIHIWYEHGIARKRVYFDSPIKKTLSENENRNIWNSISRNPVPLSQRPYEPRKDDEEGES